MSNREMLISAELMQGFIFDGQWQAATQTMAVTEPATGLQLGKIGVVDPALVAKKAQLAAQAQHDWASASADQRATVLRNAARLAEQYQAEIVNWIVRESGSIQIKAGFEASLAAKVLHEAAALPSRNNGEVLPAASGKMSLARRKPLGVVGVIAPFNFPLYLAIRAVAPALAVGNAVVLKPDTRTAVSGGFVIARLFELAGLPAGVLQVLPGDGAVGAAMTADPSINMIQFTGSTAAGRRVGEAAGLHLKKVSLELGGKNTLIILDDADLDAAVNNAVWGAYLHQGQICMAVGRVLVQRNIHDAFLKKLIQKTQSLKVGNPYQEDVQIGPLINAAQRDQVVSIIQQAVAAGAVLETGGEVNELFVTPAVLSGVTEENPAFTKEIFGPVAVVVPFDTDEDAIHLANQTEYGLSMAVISPNIGRALRVGDRLQTGILHINDQTVNDEVVNPFGGVKSSGNGASIGGSTNVDEFTQLQWLTIQEAPPAYPF